MTRVTAELADMARVLALADTARSYEAASPDEAAARERVRDIVRLAERIEDGAVELVGPIPEGSAVVLHEDPDRLLADDNEAGPTYMQLIKELLRVAGHDKFTLLVLPEGDSIELLDEREMRALGWRHVSLTDKIGTQ